MTCGWLRQDCEARIRELNRERRMFQYLLDEQDLVHQAHRVRQYRGLVQQVRLTQQVRVK